MIVAGGGLKWARGTEALRHLSERLQKIVDCNNVHIKIVTDIEFEISSPSLFTYLQ